MKPGLSFLLSLSCISLSYAIASNSAKAQINPDGTTPTNVVEGNNESIITGGTNPSSGSNLFHSFSEFSVTPDSGAFFDNAANIQNIFSRVTGANPSTIDGLIRANDANLFLINPNGIIYGSNASLQLGGSFYGSTADSILFSNGEFSAVNPDNTPILTINAPIGLSFRDNPATIDVRSTAGDATGLQITTGETFGLFGGEINLDSNTISAPGGTVELGGLAAAGTIEITELDNSFQFSFPDGVTRSNVTLSNGATINVAGADGGFINVNANNLTLSGASNFFAGIAEGLGSPEAQAGDINLNASGNINLSGVSSLQNRVNPGATGNSGNVNVTASSLNITEGAFISASTLGIGNGGDINVAVDGAVTIDGFVENVSFSRLATVIGNSAEGDGGDINISADSLSVSNFGVINTAIFPTLVNPDTGESIPGGQGNGGEIQITSNTLNLTEGGNITSSTAGIAGENGRSDAGDITINVSELLEATGGSFLQSDTFGQGDAGNVTINGENAAISFDGVGENNVFSGIFSSVRNDFNGLVGNGRSGQITINADSLFLNDGAAINNGLDSGVTGQGNNINLNADTVSISGSSVVTNVDGQQIPVFSSIASIVNQGAIGTGGNIQLTVDSLNLADSGNINTSTAGVEGENGRSDAGDITINVSESLEATGGSFLNSSTSGVGDSGIISIQSNGDGSIELSGLSNIFNNVESGARGNSNGVTINAGSLSVTEGSQIQTLVREAFEDAPAGRGNAGSITIDVDTANISGSADTSINGQQTTLFSQIASNINPGAVGRGGEIEITADTLNLAEGGNITSSTAGVLREDGQPSDAGDITINLTESLEATGGSFLQSDTFGQGDAGNVTINAENAVVSFDGVGENNVSSGISSSVRNFNGFVGNGRSGQITISADSLSLNDGAAINNGLDTEVEGEGNNIELNANTVNLSGSSTATDINGQEIPVFSSIASIVNPRATGNAGDIKINISESLNLTGGSRLSSSTFGQGDTGIISIQSNGDGLVKLSDLSNIFNNVEFGGRGNSNGISINAGSLSVTEGSQIQTLVREAFEDAPAGRGNAGSITIDVDTANISGSADTSINGQQTTFFSQIASNINPGAVGKGGEIEITANTLNLAEGGNITSSTAGVLREYGQPSDAGDITINLTESLKATGGSFLQSDTFGQGDAGNITINGENASVSFEGVREDGFFSGIFSAVNSFTDPNTQETFVGQGTGGTIDVTSNSLTLSDGAQINTSSIGQGNGGDIALRIDNRLNLRENSVISATANGNNSGGNIDIEAEFIVAFASNNDGNDILANNPDIGKGGVINITASEAILGIEERTPRPTTNDINADSGSDVNDGDVVIDAPNIDTIQGATQLPENVVDPDSTVTQACSSITGTGGTLTVKGRGNVSPLPTAPLKSDDILSGADSSDDEDVESSKPVSIDDIVPAQGAVVKEDGSIFLTPYPTSQIASRLPQNSECNVESEIKSDKVLPDDRRQ